MIKGTKTQRDTYKLLCDLKMHGSFYESAIELEMNSNNSISGEEFEKRIDGLLKRLRFALNISPT